MEELRSMFASIVGKEKFLDEGSPSLTESALENQQQRVTKPRKGAGKEKQQSPVSTTGKMEPGRTTRKLAVVDISNSNDDLPFVTDPDVDSVAEAGESVFPNVVMQAEVRIGQGSSEADVAGMTMEVSGTDHPSHAPPTSTAEVDITLSPTTVTELPPSQTEAPVQVVAAEGLVKTAKTCDSGGTSGDTNSEDGGPAALDEMNSEASPVQELVVHASQPTAETKPAEAAQQKPAEAPPAAGSPLQRRSRRPPKSEQQVVSHVTLTKLQISALTFIGLSYVMESHACAGEGAEEGTETKSA